MNKDLLLMHKDTPVYRYNTEVGNHTVLNKKLLPFTMKGKLERIPTYAEIKSEYDDIRRRAIIRQHDNAMLTWLAHRTITFSRKYAKNIYQLLAISQRQDDVARAKTALLFRAVSLQDDYWVKLDGDSKTWNDVNVRRNHLNEIIAQVALHGTTISMQGELTTPEMSTFGAYAKAWRREADGLYLHKRGTIGDDESKVEIECSHLLSKMNVNYLPYVADECDGVFTCKCKCMTTDELSILTGEDFYTYCNVNGLDYWSEMMRIDSDSIYKMWIVDYLISNKDRHAMNWGFFYNSDTMEILGCHPLFDHNNAFDAGIIQNPDIEYLFDNRMSMREAAHRAMRRVDFHFTSTIVRGDFLSERHFESFRRRAKELGIQTIVEDIAQPDWLDKFMQSVGNIHSSRDDALKWLQEFYHTTDTDTLRTSVSNDFNISV